MHSFLRRPGHALLSSRRGVLLLATLTWFGVSAPLYAQPHGARRPPEAALEHYRRAKEHYAHGRYREAITDLRAARRLDPRSPTLAFNLGRVHELLGELNEAIEMYRTYLTLLPETEQAERDRVRGVLIRLEGAKEARAQHQQRSQQSQRPVPTPPPRPSAPLEQGLGARYVERHVVDTLVWALLGTGTVGLIAGGVTGGVALARRGDVERFVLGQNGDLTDRDALDARRAGWALASDVSFGIGVGALLGAAALYLLRTQTWERLPSGVERPLDPNEEGGP